MLGLHLGWEPCGEIGGATKIGNLTISKSSSGTDCKLPVLLIDARERVQSGEVEGLSKSSYKYSLTEEGQKRPFYPIVGPLI